MVISPPTHNPRTLGTVIYIISIFYRTKNQVRGLCVGRDMIILFFGHFTEFRKNRPHPKILVCF